MTSSRAWCSASATWVSMWTRPLQEEAGSEQGTQGSENLLPGMPCCGPQIIPSPCSHGPQDRGHCGPTKCPFSTWDLHKTLPLTQVSKCSHYTKCSKRKGST